MRVHVISRCGLAHHLIVAEVCRLCDVLRVIRPVSLPGAARGPAPPAPLSLRLRRAADRLFYGARTLREDRALRAAIAARPAPSFEDRIVEVPARELSGPAGLRAIGEGGPDLLVVSGAPILRDPVLRLPRIGTINVHFGIAPAYRGQDTLFWPLHDGDYGQIGVTLHWVDAGVDSGPILARGYPALSPRDDELSIELACLDLSLRLLREVLTRLGRGERPAGEPQPRGAGGRLCRGADRTLRRDLELLRDRHLRRRRPPRSPERVELYLDRPRAATAGSAPLLP